ncbi:hypothetical protein ANN_19949 [Periplaneta americana]|uniref:Laccase n=1 Tax=Periplaneta americana TaxID=6978 RepID=A0ABQ8SB99_PERAM|nr:hypothetical protein ANN_19949 [Periplaneta americana]
MAGLCEGGNEPSGSLKAICKRGLRNVRAAMQRAGLADDLQGEAHTRSVPDSEQVCENDILLVDVVNRVPGQGFGIHWRGQPQKETPVMDGVPMVTQCPIPSSTTFQYKFRASRGGTHMWHAHTGVQLTDGIFGALIVRQSPRRDPHFRLYDVDDPSHVIVINEWSHGFAIQRLLEPNPGTSTATLLVSGRSRLKQPEGSQKQTVVETPLSTFRVTAGKRYRFRLAYAGGGRGCPITVTIAKHLLLVISLDGHPITPREVTSLVMAAGRYIFH